MLYDSNGVRIDDREKHYRWKRMSGYSAYGVSDIIVGSEIEHNGEYHEVIGIQEVLQHGGMMEDKDGALGYMALLDDDSIVYLKHYGTPRHSGRYPWGSGEHPYQRNANFIGQVEKLKREKGPDGKPLFTEIQIANSMGMNTSELRKRMSLARAENRAYEVAEYKRLKEKGMSRSAIARRMGINESTLRNYDNEEINARMTKNAKAAKLLKDRVAEVQYVQVGAGTEYQLGNLSSTGLGNTLKMLEQEGYTIHNIDVDQLGTGKKTTVKVLAAPGVEKKEIYKNIDKIRMPVDIYEQDGEIKTAKPFVSVDPKRVMVVYPKDGGDKKDGLIEIRRNVPDLDIGKNHYVQGRILVDGDHYLKGMVAYADDLPPGIDIRFNTSKHDGMPMINRENKDESVLKPIKKDQENIFGANIKPDEKLVRAHRTYIGEDGEEHQSAINIVKEEGDVDNWTKNLASQFLSKQPSKLAQQQLKISHDIAESEMKEIMAYTNPVVRAKMLEDFAGRCDRDAVHMAAAALPRQKSKFIMPLTTVKDNEAYCPSFDDGEQVALVRYPHGSISEIPIVTINNRSRKAKEFLGDAIDAIGISPVTAQRLSGADFDGDTVIAIPISSAKIRNRPQFDSLKGFSTTEAYPGYPGMHRMTKHQHGVEMGKISNLITDMTIQKAKDEEIERALKHSMVVVDAEKHGLDWKRSEEENGIAQLRRKYQNGGGASTLLSKSTGEEHILERKLKSPGVMSEDEKRRWKAGEEIYENTNRTVRAKPKFYKSKMSAQERADYDSGDVKKRVMVERAMIADGRAVIQYKKAGEKVEAGYLHDPFELASTKNRETTTPIERVYGDYARSMKDLAKQARAEARKDMEFKVDPAAAKKYSREVESLDAKIRTAEKNRPLERQAQIIANVKYRAWRYDHPEEDNEHQKREKGRLLDAARKAIGAKKLTIGSQENPLTAREWEAIQAHAISKSKLTKILTNADMQVVKRYAMPKTNTGLVPAKLSRAKSMLARGYSRQEVCEALDISEHTLIDAIGLANI